MQKVDQAYGYSWLLQVEGKNKGKNDGLQLLALLLKVDSSL